MNGRARDVLRAAWWWSTLAAALIWWAPAILLKLGALVADRVRFRLAIGLGRALVGVGMRGAARAVFRHERVRAGRRMAAIRAQRRRVASLRDGA